MDRLSRKLISFILVICLLFILLMPVGAAPSAVEIVTTPSGYTTAADVVYVTEGDIVLNWGARGEDCTFLTTYAQSYYTDGIEYDDLSQLSGGTSATDAPDSELYDALQDLMVSKHTTFTKYGGSSALDCKKFYHYTDCMLSDPSYVSTLYRGTIVGGPWDGGKSYNQEHVWPQSKCIGTASQDVGDLMQLRPAVPNENSSRNNTAYGESDGYYDPGISVRGDCARTLLYVYTRWGNTGKLWGEEGVIEDLEILLRWIEEDPVDTWEMGHNDAVQSITGVRNVFVDYPEYAWHLFGQPLPTDLQTPSGGEDGDSTSTTPTATLVTDATTLTAGDQIIIVAADYGFALSTEQKTNNRGQAAVTKDGTTVTYGSDVQILTLEKGTASGTFGLNTGTGYLSATSSSANNLKTTAALSDNGSWSISIDSTTGVASIIAGGTYTRNDLRYNSTSSLFSCYAAENSQKDLQIYRLGAPTERVIYFRNTSGWSAPYIYAWNSSATVTDAWPGNAMTKVSGTTNIYSYTLSNEATNVIFTNEGASQTPDLTIPTDGKDLYTLSTGSWSGYDPAAADYYLVGYINGANYGWEEDGANLGQYKFADGKLTATFTSDSYVFVKTGDNANWYL